MKKLPRIPKTASSLLGPVKVEIVEGLKNKKDEELLGQWRCEQRDIRLTKGLSPIVAWQTFWHEWVHSVFFDAGVQLSEKKAEAVCDAIALARTREMLDK